MITTIIALSLAATPAQAEETPKPPAAMFLRRGQWSTDRSLCVGNCKGIMNLSYTECAEFGFKQGGLDDRLGNIAVVDGEGNGIGTWVADRNGDGNLDFQSCVPPRATVYGTVDGLGLEVDIDTILYSTGDVAYTVGPIPNLVDPRHPLFFEIYGAYYAGTGEGLPMQGRPGTPYAHYTLSRYSVMDIGI